jgi:hypothetical protein
MSVSIGLTQPVSFKALDLTMTIPPPTTTTTTTSHDGPQGEA